MKAIESIRGFYSYTPPPRNPAVDRFLFLIGMVGTPLEMLHAYHNHEQDPAGFALRVFTLTYSVSALILTFRSDWGRKQSSVLTFGWLMLILLQQTLQNYREGFSLDHSIILFMGFPTGALFITSPRYFLAYISLTILMVTSASIGIEQPWEFKGRILLIFSYTTLAAVAVFFINYRLAQQLRKANERFRILAENANDIIALHDLKGHITYISPSAHRQFGYEDEEILGTSAFSLIYKPDREQAIESYHKLFLPPYPPVQLSYRVMKKDGTPIWVEAVGSAVFDENGKISQIVTTNRDISARKSAELELEAQNTELIRANRELDQFAYIVSHDLKAPLRGIATLTTLIEEDFGNQVLPEGISKHLQMMRDRTSRLERLIEDILAYSRAGKTQTQAQKINTQDCLLELVEILSLPPTFQITFQGEFPILTAKRVFFDQVFGNLLVNAHKHHDREGGQIILDCNKTEGGWNFSVSDDGPGIPENQHERIFEVFTQVESLDKTQGTGIGLAVIRRILNQVGGNIQVQNIKPRGCRFTVFWPESNDTQS
jgi:PAS domain S-box-containing protein